MVSGGKPGARADWLRLYGAGATPETKGNGPIANLSFGPMTGVNVSETDSPKARLLPLITSAAAFGAESNARAATASGTIANLRKRVIAFLPQGKEASTPPADTIRKRRGGPRPLSFTKPGKTDNPPRQIDFFGIFARKWFAAAICCFWTTKRSRHGIPDGGEFMVNSVSQELIDILQQARCLLARADNDFA
jgi:hypothetical protein